MRRVSQEFNHAIRTSYLMKIRVRGASTRQTRNVNRDAASIDDGETVLPAYRHVDRTFPSVCREVNAGLKTIP